MTQFLGPGGVHSLSTWHGVDIAVFTAISGSVADTTCLVGNVHWPDSEQYRYTHPYYLAPVVLDSALHFTVAATMEKSTQFHIPTKCEEFVYIPPETSMEQEMAKAREWMDKDVVAEIKRLQIEDM